MKKSSPTSKKFAKKKMSESERFAHMFDKSIGLMCLIRIC